ncbi:hypothetical protein E3N88_39364 [Mikania micrantha]|uniref:Pentacotripeptide-repeat region of PRORP domain-containing protein n=1 Tax=Mikania micrantha TaxID=192012 RepID=A0A5N6LWR9_9ASTR|nr:hypothetical protein E3N88_39364 [Mikania micrantha]
MSVTFVSRFLSFSLRAKNTRFSFTTLAITDPVEKYWIHLQSNEPNIEKTLTRIGAKLDSSCIKEVIKRCGLTNQSHISGLRFFIWAGIQREYRHSSYMYNIACKLFRINQNPNVIRDVIGGYSYDNCVVNVRSFKIVLNLCKEARLADEALWVLKKMNDFNCRPDTIAYNVVIRLHCEAGRMDEALSLMEEMSLINLYPDMVTFVSMVKGFCDLGRIEDASRLFKVVNELGCSPNVVAYSVLLDGICRIGNLEKGLNLLQEMENEGGACTPTAVTYTTMIRNFCEKGRSMEALTILDRMEACGCAPNRVTTSTLINGLCQEDQVKEAYRLIDKLVARWSVSKSECYSSLVVTLLRVNKFEECEKVFKRMLVSDLKPDGVACSEFLRRMCLKEKRVLDAFVLCNEIEKLGFATCIDLEIYSIMMDGLCTKSHLLEASKLAKLMVQKHIQLKAPYVQNVVKYLKNAGEMKLSKFIQFGRRTPNMESLDYDFKKDFMGADLEDELALPASSSDLEKLCDVICHGIGSLDDLEASLNKLNVSCFSSLVTQVLDSSKNKAPTRRLLRFFLWSEKHLDFKLEDRDYNHAIRVFAEKKDFIALDMLISNLGKENRSMESSTFSSIAESLVKLGRVDEALGIFKNLDKFRCPQDSTTVTSIVSALCSKGHVKRAEGVIYHHKDKISSVKLKLLIYRNVLHGWSMQENVNESRRIMKDMKGAGITPDLFCYNTYLKCLCYKNLKNNPSGLVPDALNVMIEMRTNSIAPTTISYNILLSCLGRTRRVKESIQILNTMRKTGCSPDWMSYYLVARVSYLTGRFGKGKQMVDEMIKDRLIPERKFYYDLIGLLCGVKRVNYAIELFELMKKTSLGGYETVYSLLIRNLCENGKFEKGKELWDEAAAMGLTLECSSDVLNPLITKVFKPVRKMENKVSVLETPKQKTGRNLKPIISVKKGNKLFVAKKKGKKARS